MWRSFAVGWTWEHHTCIRYIQSRNRFVVQWWKINLLFANCKNPYNNWFLRTIFFNNVLTVQSCILLISVFPATNDWLFDSNQTLSMKIRMLSSYHIIKHPTYHIIPTKTKYSKFHIHFILFKLAYSVLMNVNICVSKLLICFFLLNMINNQMFILKQSANYQLTSFIRWINKNYIITVCKNKNVTHHELQIVKSHMDACSKVLLKSNRINLFYFQMKSGILYSLYSLVIQLIKLQ